MLTQDDSTNDLISDQYLVKHRKHCWRESEMYVDIND